MQTVRDVFNASMAKLFEVASTVDKDDVYCTLFPELLKCAMLQVLDVENNYRIAMHHDRIPLSIVAARYSADDPAPLPFRDKMSAVVIPLYIASEFLRDDGNLSMSAYMREQFVSALNEMDVCLEVDVGCCV